MNKEVRAQCMHETSFFFRANELMMNNLEYAITCLCGARSASHGQSLNLVSHLRFRMVFQVPALGHFSSPKSHT